MPSLASVKASNASYAPLYVPTAVFVGGTSGIGRAMAELLARHLNGNVNICLVGRSKTAADEIIAGLAAPPNGVKHEFIQCDASELKNVHETSQVLLGRLDKINFLVLSPHANSFSAVPTSEGLERAMVLRYYARAKFLEELLPLLQKARDKGEDSRAMTILGVSASGAKVYMDDLGLKKKWSLLRMAFQTATYSDIMVKVQGKKHPDITFVHIYPGTVDTPAMHIHWIIGAIYPILKHFIYTPADCAENMMYALLKPNFASGSYWLNSKADKKKLPSSVTDDIANKVWEHTLEVIHL